MNMYLPSTLKAIFFDMDGVLYDSMKNHAISWREAFQKVGIDYSEAETYQNEGRTSTGTITLAFRKHLKQDVSPETIEAIYNHKSAIISELPQAPMLPGMQPFISAMRQQSLAMIVVTGSKQPSLLKRLEDDYGFNATTIVSGKDVIREKPHPEPYLRALERCGIMPHEAMVVENAPLGIESARRAGIFTIAVNTGPLEDRELLDSGAHIVLPDTQSLAEQWALLTHLYETRNELLTNR
jgi:HAD superfamily hydrolase (TIGR01509 family)